jgi:hypothetical protein
LDFPVREQLVCPGMLSFSFEFFRLEGDMKNININT